MIWKDFRVPCKCLLGTLKPFPHRCSIHLNSWLWFTVSFQDHRVWEHSATNQLVARRRHLRPASVPRPRLPRRSSGIVLPQTPLITVTAGTRRPVEWEVVAQSWMTNHRSLSRLVTRWIRSRPVWTPKKWKTNRSLSSRQRNHGKFNLRHSLGENFEKKNVSPIRNKLQKRNRYSKCCQVYFPALSDDSLSLDLITSNADWFLRLQDVDVTGLSVSMTLNRPINRVWLF